MISSQGNSATLSNGLVIKQSIGQQTVSGTSKKEYIVLQGFQQNYWAQLITSSINKNDLIVTTYPNPFIEDVQFEFSKSNDEEVLIRIFDTSGRLLFQENKKIKDQLIKLHLGPMPGTIFLVQISNSQLNYYTKILKSI
jgi:hypothetical protein